MNPHKYIKFNRKTTTTTASSSQFDARHNSTASASARREKQKCQGNNYLQRHQNKMNTQFVAQCCGPGITHLGLGCWMPWMFRCCCRCCCLFFVWSFASFLMLCSALYLASFAPSKQKKSFWLSTQKYSLERWWAAYLQRLLVRSFLRSFALRYNSFHMAHNARICFTLF